MRSQFPKFNALFAPKSFSSLSLNAVPVMTLTGVKRLWSRGFPQLSLFFPICPSKSSSNPLPIHVQNTEKQREKCEEQRTEIERERERGKLQSSVLKYMYVKELGSLRWDWSRFQFPFLSVGWSHLLDFLGWEVSFSGKFSPCGKFGLFLLCFCFRPILHNFLFQLHRAQILL